MSGQTSTSTPNGYSRIARVVRRGPFAQLAAIVALYAVAAATIEGFTAPSATRATLVIASFLGIAAAGQTLVILLGGIDLSVPAIITAANLSATWLIGRSWPAATAILVVIVGGTVAGLVSGYVTYRFSAPPIIVTLAVGSVVSGVILGATRGGQNTGQVPGWLGVFTSPAGHTGGVAVPPVVVLWAVLGVVAAIVLHATALGRRIYATGSNPRAAGLALVRTQRIWVGAFATSGASSALVGVLLAGFSGTGDVSVGDPYLFTSLAAVLIGGTTLVGARGDYTRTILGALLLTLLTTVLVGYGLDAAQQDVVLGVLILVIVGLYGRERRLADRV